VGPAIPASIDLALVLGSGFFLTRVPFSTSCTAPMGEAVRVQLVWQGRPADLPAQYRAQRAMSVHVAWGPGRSAPLVVSDVEEVQAMDLCRTSVVARAITFKKQHINMLDVEGISMWCGQGEISLASSRHAVC